MKILLNEDSIKEMVGQCVLRVLSERRDIIRRIGDYEDYDGYEDEDTDHEGTAYIPLDTDALMDAVAKVYGSTDGVDVEDLPEEVEIRYYISEDRDEGDYMTPSYSDYELVDWDLTDSEKKMAGDERMIQVLKIAASQYLDGIDPSELL